MVLEKNFIKTYHNTLHIQYDVNCWISIYKLRNIDL